MPSESIFLTRCMVVWYSFSFLNSSLLIAATSEPVSDITSVAAIFPAAIAINRERLPTMRTYKLVDCLPLHFIKIFIPPLITALITAETLLLPFGNLSNFTSAILAERNFSNKDYGDWSICVFCNIVSAAERLHRVQQNADSPCNAAVAVSCLS